MNTIARRTTAWALGGLALLAATAPAPAQKVKPKPRPQQRVLEIKPKPRPTIQASEPQAAQAAQPPLPPPVLLVTSDADCRVELDGAPLVEVATEEVSTVKVAAGEHLLRAYSLEVDGLSWDEVIKVPETGQVVARIELAQVIEEFKNIRFVVEGGVVEDHKTGLMWTESVRRDVDWKSGVEICEESTRRGYSDWRLPALNEISSLYWPDHPEPPKSTNDPGMFSPVQVVPVLVYAPFEHNRMSSLWVQDGGPKKPFRCSFESDFDCLRSRGKKLGDVLCVRAGQAQFAAGDAEGSVPFPPFSSEEGGR